MVHTGEHMGYGRYLRRRGYTWYFRCRWPKHFAAFRLSGELQVGLRTRDYKLALHRARLLRTGMETTLMSRFTPSMSKADAEAMVRRWIDSALWRRETHLAETDGIAFFDPGEIETLGRENAAELDALLQFGDRRFAGEQKAAIARALGPAGSELQSHAELIDQAGWQMDVTVDRATPDGRLNARMFLKGFATLVEEAREAVASIPRHIQAGSAKPELPKFPFLSFWDSFRAKKLEDRKWKKDTAAGNDATAKLFRNLIGDLPTNKIDGEVAASFRSKYLTLPWNYHSHKRWKKFTPGEILSKIAALTKDEQNKIERITPTAANKHLSNLSDYWDHMVVLGKIPREIENPFRGHLSARNQGRAARDEHPMWPVDWDIKLFKSALMSGCKSIHRRAQPGNEIHRDALFWVTWMGRLMGVREDEACDRTVGDIQFIETDDGVLAYIKVRDSKTGSSSRDLPLPQLLLDFGFLEYRYHGRRADEPLFPELIPQGIEPRRSDAFSGRFIQYRKGTKLYNPDFDFRSFRGNVETELRNLPDVNAGWIDELIGHESPARRSEGARYTKQLLLTHLKRTIDRVAIGVDPYKPKKTPPLHFPLLKYTGVHGEPAPGAAKEIVRYVGLAQREMRKADARAAAKKEKSGKQEEDDE